MVGLRSALRRRLGRIEHAPEPVSDPPAAIDRENADIRNLELLLGFLLAEDSNCVDIGANQGRFLYRDDAARPAWPAHRLGADSAPRRRPP